MNTKVANTDLVDADSLPKGIWRSTYRYFSSGRNREFESEQYVRLHRQGRRIVLETVPGTSPAYVLIRLSLDGDAATGSWEEETDPNGYYHGTIYHGAIQVVASKDRKTLHGQWAGFGKEAKVNTGPWKLEYVGDAVPA